MFEEIDLKNGLEDSEETNINYQETTKDSGLEEALVESKEITSEILTNDLQARSVVCQEPDVSAAENEGKVNSSVNNNANEVSVHEESDTRIEKEKESESEKNPLAKAHTVPTLNYFDNDDSTDSIPGFLFPFLSFSLFTLDFFI